MTTRRGFVTYGAAAALSLTLARRSSAAAPHYDLIVTGGRVIDPARGLDAVRDVAVSAGRIAAIEASITSEAEATLDARGKLVVPGLIDIHTHAARDARGPELCLADGVTGWIDAGSAGAEGIDAAVAIAKSSRQPGRILINIGRAGIVPEGDTMDLARADVAAARGAIARHRDYVVGVKARLSRNVAGDNDYEVLRRAKQAAAEFRIPVMIHMGQTASALPTLLGLLGKGDIVTHMFAPPPNGVLDAGGRVLPAVLEAHRRGVVFDVGNGVAGHLRWDVVEEVMAAGLRPDTISTDWNVTSRTTGVVDLPNCLSKFLSFGMGVPDVVACATANAARTFDVFRRRGTLKVGAPADIAVLELRSGEFEFLDNYDNRRTGRERLFPSATVLGGQIVARA